MYTYINAEVYTTAAGRWATTVKSAALNSRKSIITLRRGSSHNRTMQRVLFLACILRLCRNS